MAVAQKVAHLYLMQSETGLIKVGRSVSPEARRRRFECASGLRVALLVSLHERGGDEGAFKAALSGYRTQGEWFEDTEECRRIVCDLFSTAINWRWGAGAAHFKARKIRLERKSQEADEDLRKASAASVAKIIAAGAKRKRRPWPTEYPSE